MLGRTEEPDIGMLCPQKQTSGTSCDMEGWICGSMRSDHNLRPHRDLLTIQPGRLAADTLSVNTLLPDQPLFFFSLSFPTRADIVLTGLMGKNWGLIYL